MSLQMAVFDSFKLTQIGDQKSLKKKKKKENSMWRKVYVDKETTTMQKTHSFSKWNCFAHIAK